MHRVYLRKLSIRVGALIFPKSRRRYLPLGILISLRWDRLIDDETKGNRASPEFRDDEGQPSSSVHSTVCNKTADYGYGYIQFNGSLRTDWHLNNAIYVLIS